MSEAWFAILERHVAAKGRPVVARELDVSAATLSLVLSDQYPASTKNVEKKVMSIYGHDGKVRCPVLGEIEPSLCTDNWERAQKIKGAGNPATIRLYIACRKCDLRSN
jgi:hypothetical protein